MAGIIVIVLAVVIVAAILIWKPWGLKAADYQKADNAVVDISKQGEKVSNALVQVADQPQKTDTKLRDKNVAEAKSAIKQYDAMNVDFGQQKAIKDKDVNDKYQAYLKKSKLYSQYASELADSLPSYSDAYSKCNKEPEASMSDSAKYMSELSTYMSDCKVALEATSKVPNKAIAQSAGKTASSIGKLEDVVKQMSDLVSNPGAPKSTEQIDKLSDLSKQLNNLSNDISEFSKFRATLQKQEDDANPNKALEDLHTVLYNKTKK